MEKQLQSQSITAVLVNDILKSLIYIPVLHVFLDNKLYSFLQVLKAAPSNGSSKVQIIKKYAGIVVQWKINNDAKYMTHTVYQTFGG